VSAHVVVAFLKCIEFDVAPSLCRPRKTYVHSPGDLTGDKEQEARRIGTYTGGGSSNRAKKLRAPSLVLLCFGSLAFAASAPTAVIIR
jgi:hypothetical protein